MHKNFKILILIFFVTCVTNCFSNPNKNKIDSLKFEIKKASTNKKIYLYIDLLNVYSEAQKLDEAKILVNKLIAITKNKDSVYFYLLTKKCRILFSETNFLESKQLAEKLIENKNIDEYTGIKGEAMSVLGMSIGRLGDFKKAISLHNQAINLFTKVNNDKGIAKSYNNIAGIYYDQLDYKEAIVYFKKALEVTIKSGNRMMQGNILGNIGSAYHNIGDKKTALEYYTKSMNINLETNNYGNLLYDYSNISSLNLSLHNLKEAEFYSNKALDLMNTTKVDLYTQTVMLLDRGELLLELNRDKEAILFLQKSIEYAKKSQSLLVIHKCYNSMGIAYEKLGDYKKSNFYFKEYIKTRDSIINESIHKDVTKENLTYVFNSEKFKDSVVNSEKQKTLKQETIQEKESKKKQQIISIISILFLCIASALLLIIRKQYNKAKLFNTTVSEQKNTIEQQKVLVEEKNKEIVDSINYAKRIQKAILPSNETLQSYIQNYFLIYKPKDIVAGDFYWAYQKNQITYVAVADCTGHGVPGAIVSVICSNALNRAVKDFNLTKPNEILNKTRELVSETFETSQERINDGMDISLLSIQKSNTSFIINWSGANTPLWYIKDTEFNSIKATKQTIGISENPIQYNNIEINLNSGDILFLLTDGYHDQFGGERDEYKGKKFMSKNLKKLLSSLNNVDLTQQKLTLNKVHNEWKGNFEQVDDITIIGIKL